MMDRRTEWGEGVFTFLDELLEDDLHGKRVLSLANATLGVMVSASLAVAVIGPGLKGLLERACAIGRRWADLKDATLKAYEADLERRLNRLSALDPTHAAGLKLRRMIRKVRPHLFVFVQIRDLEPTNNGSERALRPCAVYRKITNGFRQEWGAHLYAHIRSVIETARRHSIRAINAIRLTLKGQPIQPTMPALPGPGKQLPTT